MEEERRGGEGNKGESRKDVSELKAEEINKHTATNYLALFFIDVSVRGPQIGGLIAVASIITTTIISIVEERIGGWWWWWWWLCEGTKMAVIGGCGMLGLSFEEISIDAKA